MARRTLAFLGLFLALAVAGLWLARGRRAPADVRPEARASGPMASAENAALDVPSDADPEPARAPVAVPVPASAGPERSQAPTNTLVLVGGDAVIKVQVLAKEDHRPLESVRLELRPLGRSPEDDGFAWLSAPTDRDGRTAFDAAPGDYTIAVDRSQKRFPPASADVLGLEAGTTRPVVLELSTGMDAVFHGVLVDDGTGEPVASATILVFDGDQGGSIAQAPEDLDLERVPSDPSGRFEVAYLSWKRTAVRVDAPGYTRATCRLLGGSTDEHPFELRLRRAASLAVTVTDRGRPLDGLDVVATIYTIQLEVSGQHEFYGTFESNEDEDDETPRPWEMVRRATTDVAGIARFEDLATRAELLLEIRRGEELVERVPGDHRLEPGEQGQLTVDLGAAATIRGTVVDEQGQPVADLDLWLVDTSTTGGFVLSEMLDTMPGAIRGRTRSGSNGAFALDAVPVGRWLLGPAHFSEEAEERDDDESRAAPVGRLVEVGAADSVVEVTLEVKLGHFIRGHVVHLPESTHDSFVVFAQANGLLFETRELDEEDHFVLGPLVPGQYVVSGYVGARPSSIVSARADQDDVVIDFDPGPIGTVRGRVRGFRGSTVRGEVVFVGARFKTAFDAPSAQLEQDGSFVVTNCSAGTYDVFVSTSDGLVANLAGAEITASNSEYIELDLVRGARLNVSAKGEGFVGGLALVTSQGAYVGVGGVAAGSPDSTLEPLFVPPGNLQIELLVGPDLPPKSVAERTVFATAGEDVEIVFDLDAEGHR